MDSMLSLTFVSDVPFIDDYTQSLLQWQFVRLSQLRLKTLGFRSHTLEIFQKFFVLKLAFKMQ